MIQEPITEDPDVRDAIETFRATVVQIRSLSQQLFELQDDSSPYRDQIRSTLDDLVDGMRLRCERLPGIELDDLFRLINADLASRPTTNVAKPHGEYLRVLCDENTAAHAHEAQLHREITKAQQLLARATERRLAADRACAGYVAGWARRGEISR